MSKIVRLTESDLTRIVKRVINEQQKQDPHFIFKNLKNRFIPLGFKVVEYPGSNIVSLEKGDDMNGAFIQHVNGKIRWGVQIDGQTKVEGSAVPNGYNEEQIFNQIIKAMDPFKDYKFKKTPYQG